MDGHVGIEARVTFEAYAGCRSTSFLEIVNDGTTAIYYDWKVKEYQILSLELFKEKKRCIDGFIQERRNSIVNALELRLSCTNPSICNFVV